MVRKYAPNARVGLHASAWARGPDVNINSDPTLDVVGEANEVGGFLVGCGANDGDFVVVEASDRDAAGSEPDQGGAGWHLRLRRRPLVLLLRSRVLGPLIRDRRGGAASGSVHCP